MTPTLEIVRFRVHPQHVDALVAGRDAALAAVRERHPGLLSAQLAQLEGDQWVDVVLWETKDQALAAAAEVMSIPAFAALCGNISEVISMEHAEVRSLAHA